LGATLFAALTGHAAFERRSGEQIVAQFLRIASESAPDLRESGISSDVADIVETAMSRDPQDRPSAVALGEELQKLQSKHGVPVADMALRPGAKSSLPQTSAPAARRPIGNLPAELTTFVGRTTELSAVKHEHAGELTELRRRHAEWYRQLINDAEADWMSPRQVEWMKRLEREGRNIRAALEFSLAEPPDTALDIAGALHPFGIARGVLTETRHWLDRGPRS
jgi:serine/threonine protein kinase